MSDAWARMSGDALKIDRLEDDLAAARAENAKLREAIFQARIELGLGRAEAALAWLDAALATEEPQP